MRRAAPAVPTLSVILAGWLACAAPDPYGLALRERQELRAELLSWSPAGDRVQFEVEVRGRAGTLAFLTVLITQYDERGDPIRADRVPLRLDGIETTGVKQILGSVPAGSGEPDSLSVQVEASPPEGTEGEFPELGPFPAGG